MLIFENIEINRLYNLNWHKTNITMGTLSNNKIRSDFIYSACIKGCAGKRICLSKLINLVGVPDYGIGTRKRTFVFYWVFTRNDAGFEQMMMLDVVNNIIVGGGTNSYENFRKSSILSKCPTK